MCCLISAHVINLGNVDMMGHITKLAAVANATAIWEYDPEQTDNRVLGDSLDVITTIRTLAIKVCIFPISKYNASLTILNSLLYSGIRSAYRVLS